MQFSRNKYQKKYGEIKIYCIMCRKQIKKHIRITYQQYLKQKFCSKECKGKWQMIYLKNKNNPNYRHGLSSFLERLKGCILYRKWRKKIFKRDNWVCQKCGKRGGNLEAHHIKSFTYFSELRFNINNGITLCRECHKKITNYHPWSSQTQQI